MEPQLFLISETAADSISRAEAAEPASAARDAGGPAGAGGHVATPTPSRWRLDDITKVQGYRGIAQARAALQRATARAAELNGRPVQEPAA